ncbi:MAG: hypothetical protein QM817_34600 [Archangium sp.]
MKSLRAFFILALVSCSPPVTVEPPHFLWSDDAQSLDNPFPDERLLGTGGLRPRWFQPFLPQKAVTARSASYFNKIGAQFAREVDATGSFGATLLPASEALDPDSLIGCQCVVRMVRGDNGMWQVLERNVAVEHPRDTLAKRNLALPYGYPEFIATRPTIPLPELHDGLLVVLRGPKTKAGVFFGRGKAWASAHTQEWPLIAAALTVSPDDILFTVPQRAGNITAAPKSFATWADAHPSAVTIPPHAVVADENNGSRPVGLWQPTDNDWTVLNPWLEAHPFARPASHVGRVVIGEFGARDLRENGTIVKPEWLADPTAAPVVPLRFVLSLPKGPKPAGGWPVVMGQHGVNARNTPRTGVADAFCLEWAEPLAARGLGCLGIDAPSHGSRGNFTGFFTVDDLPALRDRMREMTFDLLQVEAAIPTIDIDGDAVPDLAPRVRYFGNSMGAIMGSGFVPVSNRVTTAVLNVPGAGLSNVVMSRFLQDLIGLLIVAQTDIAFDSPEYIAAFPLFRAVSQPLFDPGDPVNVAPSVKSEVNVLLQAGIGDKVIPLDTSSDLANALRLTAPAAGNKHAFMQVLPQSYGEAADYNGHNVIWDIPVIREQAMRFLETDGAELQTP